MRNLTAFYAGETSMEQAPTRKRGPQPEGEVNKEIARWRSQQGNLLLERNKRRLATPPGMDSPIMLGWLVEGSSDWVGHESVVITPEMVGKRIAVALYIETKRRDGGVTSEAQDKFLDNARDAGAMVGIARSYEDCGLIRARWWERMNRG